QGEGRPPRRGPAFEGGRVSGPAAISSTHDEAVDQENDDGSTDGQQPGAEVEELLEPPAEDHATDPAAQQGADDAEQKRDDPAATLLAGQDQLCDRTGDETEKKESEEAHESLHSLSAHGGLPYAHKNARFRVCAFTPCGRAPKWA